MIPIELQERILDCLHGDIHTLKRCSFVCRAWRPTTRIHLFSEFQVLYDAGADDPDLNYCGHFVEEVLHLADYIQDVDIQDGCGVLLDEETSEPDALCTILDRTHLLRRFSLSTFCGNLGRVRPWTIVPDKFRDCLSSTLHRSLHSLTHLFLNGFSWGVADFELLRGMRRLEYVGLERMSLEYDQPAHPVPLTPSDDGTQQGTLRTLTLYFNFSDPANGTLVAAVIAALADVKVSHITNLRLGGLINPSVFEALPRPWLSNLTHLALDLTNLNPSSYFVSTSAL
jgi:hypothetical protein